MKINDRPTAAIVARNAAIVARETARRVRTVDSVRTTDPAASHPMIYKRRTRDTWLNAEALPRNPEMFGRRWIGVFTAELEAMSAKDRATALDALHRVLDDYANGSTMASGSMNQGDFGQLSTANRPEQVFDVGSGVLPEDINRANDAFYSKRSTTDRAAELSTRATPDSIMAAQGKFWAGLLGRPANQSQLPVSDALARRGAGTSPEDINEMNRRFYGSQG
jgi:hypothetical protein